MTAIPLLKVMRNVQKSEQDSHAWRQAEEATATGAPSGVFPQGAGGRRCHSA